METLDFAIVPHVQKMKDTVIPMMSARMVFFVDQKIVKFHLVLTQKLIVVINQLLEMKIFVLQCLAEKMKEIVILMMNVKMVFLVAQIIVQPHLVFLLLQIVVP